MDPVGPWYASYNRLANVPAAAASGEFHHLAGTGTALPGHNPAAVVPSTTSQILLQAAHTTASLAGQLGSSTASPFNPGGFLSPPPVGYDAVFSPLFHHANPKPAHYSSTINAQHRQALVQAQAVAASKQAAVESELTTLRENYASHHQSLASQGSTFFDQSSASGGASGLAWQGNNQLPSPFGILPHESVVPSSPSPATTKASTVAYDNFNVHFAAQTLNNHLNSQLAANINKCVRSVSPQVSQPAKPAASQVSVPVSAAFFQTPTTFSSTTENVTSYSTAKTGPITAQQEYTHSGSKCFSSKGISSSSHLAQQSCIVSVPVSAASGKDSSRLSNDTCDSPVKNKPSNFIPPLPSKSSNSRSDSKSQNKNHTESSVGGLGNRNNNNPCSSVSSKSTPVSYSVAELSSRINYTGSTNKSSHKNSVSSYPVSQQSSSFGQYQTNHSADSEVYSRNKNVVPSEINYPIIGTQVGPDCGVVVVPRRPSPLQAHSQASPLGHVPSPAYPMYNSPMNSAPSPQQHTDLSQNQTFKSNQIAPKSPINVAVCQATPQTQTSQVAYSSVITRALCSEQMNKAYENKYEHSQSRQTSTQPHESRWESERRQPQLQSSKKFLSSNNSSLSSNTPVESERVIKTSPIVTSQQRSSNNSDEKRLFYDTGQASLQDLSGCRTASVMTKNIQQSCQIQQDLKNCRDNRSSISSQSKNTPRKKSNEKQGNHSDSNNLASVAFTEYLNSRVPPPAHVSGSGQHNGTYFELERWNIPPSSKMFSAATAFGNQPSIHSNNFSNQSQGLMVPHPHSHSTLPYFATFHIPQHPPDLPPAIEYTHLQPVNDSTPIVSSTIPTPETRDDEPPKVVVPNIEEELGFLAEQRSNSTVQTPPAAIHQSPAPISSPQETGKIADKKLTVPVTSAGSSFMASYLKFLQGERDKSPPPATRGGRKATWSRSNTPNNKTYSEQSNVKSDQTNIQNQQNSNGVLPPPGSVNSNISLNATGVLSSVGNISSPNNITASNNINSVGIINTPAAMMSSLPVINKSVESQDDSRYYSLSKDRKRKFDGTDGSFDNNDDETRRLSKPVLNVPSTPLNEKGKKGRAAVNKGPAVVTSPQNTIASKKPRAAVQPPLPAMQAQSHQQYYYQQPEEVGTHGVGIDYNDYSSEEESNNKKLSQQRSLQQNSSLVQQNIRPTEEMPYQPGEFVAIKTELNETWPSIWRVDGKALLQKYEPFEQNGKVLYRNISTYAAWNPENKKIYVQVPVRVRVQTQMESIVEFVRNEMPLDDNDFIDKRMQETSSYQDNFEVYIQTLISHALDPNFLTEIFQEQDEYFLTNVKTVDEITEERRHRILTLGSPWSRGMEAALSTWPCLNSTLLSPPTNAPLCTSCRTARANQRIQLYGQPYIPSTLEPCQLDHRIPYEKEMFLCRACFLRVELYSRISHQKYLMFIECNKRVAEKRAQDPHKDTTIILNELLADEQWLSQLFRDVRQSWAEAEAMDRKLRQGASRQLM